MRKLKITSGERTVRINRVRRGHATRSNIPKHVSGKQDKVAENQNHKAIV
jgi:hypothetical protein